MFEARSGSAEIDENDVNEALDAGTDGGKCYRLRWDVTSKWKVRREEPRERRRELGETRARHSEHKARRDDGNVLLEGGTTARKVDRMRDTGWDLLSSSCGLRRAHINTS